MADKFHTDSKKVTQVKWCKGGGTKDGYYCLIDGDKKPFHCPSKEMLSIKLDSRDIVADIGAYTGQYAMICAKAPVKEVRSYEPTPRSFSVLEKYNEPNLKVFNLAVVGNDDKQREFYISCGIGVTNSLIEKRKSTKLMVNCINYDDVIKDCTVVKIDIEGGEYECNLIQPHIRAYIIDFHRVGKDWLDKSKKIIQELNDLGYICIIEPNFNCGWTQAGSWVKQDYKFEE